MRKSFYLFPLFLLAACGSSEDEKIEGPKPEVEKLTPQEVHSDEPSENPLESTVYYYSGAINRTYPFHMKLIVQNDEVNGSYYYDKHRKELDIKGKVVNGKLVLDEIYNDKITGHFYSTVLTKDSISGDWKSPKGTEFPFAVTSCDYDAYEFSLNKMKRTWSDDAFFSFVERFKPITLPHSFDPTEGKHADDPDPRESFLVADVQNFLIPDYDPEEDFEYQYDYAGRYEADNYIALFYYESYYPGVFGIDNRHVVLRTYDKGGDLIDEKYLACDCMDRNYYDEYWIDEELAFDGKTLKITGIQGSNSNEWAEEENMPVFDNRKDVSYSYTITQEGKIKKQ